MRANYWLPETTSWGEPLNCWNCAKKDTCKFFREEHMDWVCGEWQETEQVQMTMWKEES